MGTLIDKIDELEQVSELVLKGFKTPQIARKTGLSASQVKYLVRQHEELLKRKVEEDPEFLDRLQENTLEALAHMDLLISEAWETYEVAKTESMVNQQINLLKVAGDLAEKRAKLLQLMGAKVDSGMMARMNKAEQVNAIVTEVIKDVIADCPRCKVEAQVSLAQAFNLMNKREEAVDMEPIDDNIEDAVIVQEEEQDPQEHAIMMGDIVRPE